MKNFIDLPKALKNYATTIRFTADINGISYPLQEVLYGAIRAVAVIGFDSYEVASEALAVAVATAYSRCHEYNPSIARLSTFGSKLGYFAALHVRESELRHSCRFVRLNGFYEDDDDNAELAERRSDAMLGFALSAEDEFIRKEDYDALERHIESLCPKSRQVIRLTEEGLRGESLGKALGCNANSASVRANRAKRELRMTIEANKAA